MACIWRANTGHKTRHVLTVAWDRNRGLALTCVMMTVWRGYGGLILDMRLDINPDCGMGWE